MLSFLRHRGAISAHADRFVRCVTSDDTATRAARRSGQRRLTAKTVEKAATEVAGFVQQLELDFLGRALLANQVKWGLRDKGYPDEHVEAAVEQLVLACCLPAPAPARGPRARVPAAPQGLLR